ncbi:MAG: hypothetical protein M1828_001398 [Chrysothrix sp. TS-e1954]|nr:MAG: hypothetical protein M1828_001398 [Chrysothrix sp. TS-e1954]
MSRLSLSDADKEARDWFAETRKSLGCTLTIDAMGNQFAKRPGKQEGLATCAGSHLDTQPTGGRYDGILGITAGIEMLRALKDAKIETEYPVGVINWTNEEGARFPISMVSSGVWSGEIALERAHNLASVVRGESATMRSELERIGYLGDLSCNHRDNPIAAHFELHIEQGPILEKEARKVGIVKGVQAYKWFTITVTGKDCHTGTTDLSSRADALLAASHMIVYARKSALRHEALASVGIIEAKPGSTNTVPGEVNFSLDIHAGRDEVVEQLERNLRSVFGKMASSRSSDHYSDRVKVNWREDSHSPAVHFHEDCIQCVIDGVKDTFGDDADKLSKQIVSGAGHDSVYTSKRVPTCMIFVPSRNGISHNPEEYTSPEDCAIGAQILPKAVLNYDTLRKARGA